LFPAVPAVLLFPVRTVSFEGVGDSVLPDISDSRPQFRQQHHSFSRFLLPFSEYHDPSYSRFLPPPGFLTMM